MNNQKASSFYMLREQIVDLAQQVKDLEAHLPTMRARHVAGDTGILGRSDDDPYRVYNATNPKTSNVPIVQVLLAILENSGMEVVIDESVPHHLVKIRPKPLPAPPSGSQTQSGPT